MFTSTLRVNFGWAGHNAFGPTNNWPVCSLILRKISKIGATRCQIFRLKCTKFAFAGVRRRPSCRGAYSAPPDSLVELYLRDLLLKEGRGTGKRRRGEEKVKARRGGGRIWFTQIFWRGSGAPYGVSRSLGNTDEVTRKSELLISSHSRSGSENRRQLVAYRRTGNKLPTDIDRIRLGSVQRMTSVDKAHKTQKKMWKQWHSHNKFSTGNKRVHRAYLGDPCVCPLDIGVGAQSTDCTILTLS